MQIKTNIKKSHYLYALVVFVVSYLVTLLVWLYLKNYYAILTVKVASNVTAILKGVKLTNMSVESDKCVAYFLYEKYIPLKGLVKAEMDIALWTSKYTYNVPLTIALIVSFALITRWKKRSIFEVAFILFLVHMLYIVTFQGLQIYYVLASEQLIKQSKIVQFIWEFLWNFTNSMVIRFEPFLVILYLYFRQIKPN